MSCLCGGNYATVLLLLSGFQLQFVACAVYIGVEALQPGYYLTNFLGEQALSLT